MVKGERGACHEIKRKVYNFISDTRIREETGDGGIVEGTTRY